MTSDYRSLLRTELEQRAKRNPSYSLRAFAKALDLTAPHLSAILNGKKGLSPATAAKVAAALPWNEEEKNFFIELVKLQQGNKAKPEQKEQLQNLLAKKSFQSMNLEQFKMISDWYHLSILEVFDLEQFEANTTWIADCLEITKEEVETSLNRLEKLGFVKKTKAGWQRLNKNLATPSASSTAIRNYHHQMLRKSSHALDTQSMEDRDYSSVVMSIDKKQIPEAKEWIKDFRRKFFSDLDKNKTKNAVYCLAIQFFQISNK